MDGRRKVELGVPATADVGDVVQSLLSLYPKLRNHLSSDGRSVRNGLQVFVWPEGDQGPRNQMREGQKLMVVAAGDSEGPGLGRGGR